MLTYLQLTPEERPQYNPPSTLVANNSRQSSFISSEPPSGWLVLTPNVSAISQRKPARSKFVEAIEDEDDEQCIIEQTEVQHAAQSTPKRRGIRYALRFGKLRRVLALRKP